MPSGSYAYDYLSNPSINKPLDDIFRDLNQYTAEILDSDMDSVKQNLNVLVVCPPLYYDKKFIKGLMISNGVDLVMKHFPLLKEIFIPVAVSMSYAYPTSEHADAYLTMYSNPEREQWFKENYPNKQDKHLIPLEDADFTNEYFLRPSYPEAANKDIDLLCVSTLSEVKNLPMIAEALKVYHKKYNPIKMTLLSRKSVTLDNNKLDQTEQEIYRQIQKILIHPQDYIEFAPIVVDYSKMVSYYNRAKATILGSLLEGKNRSIHESQSCNTPILYNCLFNQYIRGNDSIANKESGLTFNFDPESMADSIHLMQKHHRDFQPRKNFTRKSGRKNFFNKALDSVPYYAECLEGYTPNQHFDNEWLNLATTDNYGLSLHKFLYESHTWGTASGPVQIVNLIQRYIHIITSQIQIQQQQEPINNILEDIIQRAKNSQHNVYN